MADQTEISDEQRRRLWLERLREEFLKLEMPSLGEHLPRLSEENCPEWVERIERELALALFPVARFNKGLELTPKRLGAILGHQCASAVWLMEWFASPIQEEALKTLEKKTGGTVLDSEQLGSTESALKSMIEQWYPAMRRLAKRALCSAVDQSYEDMTDFLVSYSQAFARKPKSFKSSDFGSRAFEVYLLLLLVWPLVERLRSVAELHAVLVKCLGPYKAGDLKRIEKLCQRIGLKFRKPGRPKKSK